jgi:hypothetical protein
MDSTLIITKEPRNKHRNKEIMPDRLNDFLIYNRALTKIRDVWRSGQYFKYEKYYIDSLV